LDVQKHSQADKKPEPLIPKGSLPEQDKGRRPMGNQLIRVHLENSH